MRTVSIAVVLVLVVLGALGFVFKGYFDQKAAADSLATELAANNASLIKLSQEKQALEFQIQENVSKQANLEPLIAAAGESVPARMSSTTILRDILNLCDRYSVSVLPLTSSDWASVQIQNRPYYVFKMPLQLSGTPINLSNFVQTLQNQLYPTLVIENFVLSQPANSQLSTVSLNIAVYAR